MAAWRIAAGAEDAVATGAPRDQRFFEKRISRRRFATWRSVRTFFLPS
jgi:hypothetical protein